MTAWVDDTRRVVVKIGSRVLVDEAHILDEPRVHALTRQMAALRDGGRDVVCVSSGAIAAGLADLGFSDRPRDLPSLQAAAALGQSRLIGLYRHFFAEHGIAAAQVLLTRADLQDRTRHLNARNTFSRLLRAGVVPIVNENDTVAVDEIRVGDNDLLSALVACLIRADVLVMLTTADGLLTRPPVGSTGESGGELVKVVDRITPETHAMAGESESSVATGGMRSKLQAAEMVTTAGERAVIANGRTPDVLTRIFNGEQVGTVFEPRAQRLEGRKRWIAFFDHARGDIEIDSGAARALRTEGRSLLAVGITAVRGTFDKGDPVRIVDPDGAEIGRALVNYRSDEVVRILGCKSGEIEKILGCCEYDEVVHRDNLVLI
ncbi:MAG: glutamate 5-kinase [Planctomycetota bacterium]|nr:MAG: glutamate 5-kinase [Planctomycetota bacterium]